MVMVFRGEGTIVDAAKSIMESPITTKKVKTEDSTETIEYFNSICAFDIETSSFYAGDEKQNIMYIYMLEINGIQIIGRTWNEFLAELEYLQAYCGLDNEHRIVIYVHNLAYEFQYLRKLLNWSEVFASDMRKVIYAVSGGFEFRCSFMLSGSSLANLTLTKHDIHKKVGDLDYSKIRHSRTHLTETEMGYCLGDVDVLSAYIDEQMDIYDRDITKIPMTNTGRVRQFFRDILMPGDNRYKSYKYKKFIKELTVDSEDEYNLLKQAFTGGFTHSNYKMTGKTHENVRSMDFTSSYPAVMVAEKYPMRCLAKYRGHYYDEFNNERYVTIENLRAQKDHVFIFNICLYDVVAVCSENYISESKCSYSENVVVNNGRVMSADVICITITNVDYDIIEQAYDFTAYEIGDIMEYEAKYLPTDIIKGLQQLYANKTELKDVEGEEVNYLLSKGMFNSSYGMMVEDFVRDEIDYVNTQDWVTAPGDSIEEQCEAYNNNYKRFLYYPWGVFVTAYARRNLWSGILELGDDYIYSDTDSVKYINADKHAAYFEAYNEEIWNKIVKACEFHGLDVEAFAPRTIKGARKPLGVWDYDGDYDKFKTLGAKRYLVSKDGKCKCTIAGVSKKLGSAYFNTLKNPFDAFNDGLVFPVEYSGRQVVTYLDNEQSGKVMDLNGKECEYHELSSIHMEAGEYHMTLSPVYSLLLNTRLEARY